MTDEKKPRKPSNFCAAIVLDTPEYGKVLKVLQQGEATTQKAHSYLKKHFDPSLYPTASGKAAVLNVTASFTFKPRPVLVEDDVTDGIADDEGPEAPSGPVTPAMPPAPDAPKLEDPTTDGEAPPPPPPPPSTQTAPPPPPPSEPTAPPPPPPPSAETAPPPPPAPVAPVVTPPAPPAPAAIPAPPQAPSVPTPPPPPSDGSEGEALDLL